MAFRPPIPVVFAIILALGLLLCLPQIRTQRGVPKADPTR